QKRVMDMASQAAFAQPMVEASFSEMSLEQVEAEREALRREKRQLEEERRRFTEAAIELGNERSDLLRERQEFETRRTAQGTAELLAGLPATPQWMRGMDAAQATPLILDQLKSMYQGTPTTEVLASMMAGFVRRPEDDEYPEMEEEGARGQQLLSPDQPRPRLKQDAPVERVRSTGAGAGQRAPLPARTPVDVRSARAPRLCTRPGCAAHAPHSHDDSTPAMELKPPVPRFRRPESLPASRSPSRQQAQQGQQQQQRRPLNGTATSGSTRQAATATAAAASSRTHAASIFK
ncbi:hypothetical protein IWW38_004754, partial [Coemansia aciculifera]